MINSESLTYEVNYRDYEIKVTYYNNIIEVSVNGWGTAYRFELTQDTRRCPLFTRFTKFIRDRIFIGIFLCQQLQDIEWVKKGHLND